MECFNRYIEELKKNDGVDNVYINCQNKVFQLSLDESIESLHNIRSLSKLVVSLCIGILIDKKDEFGIDISLETKVLPYLKSISSIASGNAIKLDKIRIIDLLNQTTGFNDKTLLFKSTIDFEKIDQLLDIVVNSPIVYAPGEHFIYSNAASFLLSCILQSITGCRLDLFAQKYLFEPLGIFDFIWEPYGKYCPGATGLQMSFSSFLKIIALIVNNYAHKKSDIISYKYIKLLVEYQKEIIGNEYRDEILQPIAYGLHVFKSRKGFIYVNGAGGQLFVYYPEKKLYMLIFSHLKTTRSLTSLTMQLMEAFV